MYCNAQMSSKQLREICVINQAGENLLKRAMEKLNLSARAYDRILKVSRTIADLAASDDIKVEHLAEAIQYRSLDREGGRDDQPCITAPVEQFEKDLSLSVLWSCGIFDLTSSCKCNECPCYAEPWPSRHSGREKKVL
jgi:hypothetical protein